MNRDRPYHPEITSISIEGFKSIERIKDLPLRPINVLIGANGSGKSNFIGAFSLLQAERDETGMSQFLRDQLSMIGEGLLGIAEADCIKDDPAGFRRGRQACDAARRAVRGVRG